jgi:photosystem II stability/assembly factor-like uncharacterized protein
MVAFGCASSHKATVAPTTTTPSTNGLATSTTESVGGHVPAGFSPIDVAWVGDTQGWALGTVSTGCSQRPCTSVVQTVNGGQTWAVLSAPKAYVPFFDNPATGPSPCTATSACVQSIRFANANVGYIFGENSLWLTTNGGRSWTERSTDDTVALEVEEGQVLRIVQPGGFCTGGCLLQVESAPEGTTLWHSIRVPALAGYGEALAVEGPNLYLEILQDGAPTQFFRSIDAGANWSTFNDPCATTAGKNANASAIGAGPGGSLAVGCTASDESEPAFTVVSSDAGANFGSPGGQLLHAVAGASPGQERIDDVAAVTGERLAALVTSGNIMYICMSSDAGTTWTVTATSNAIPKNGLGYFDLRFQDAMNGWAVIDGTTLTTTDGGSHWTPDSFRSE